MTNHNVAELDSVFAALADPTRRAMVERLRRGECSVSELAEPFAISLPAVSKHLRVLERAALLRQDRRGRVRVCRLNPDPLGAASAWITMHQSPSEPAPPHTEAFAMFFDAQPPDAD